MSFGHWICWWIKRYRRGDLSCCCWEGSRAIALILASLGIYGVISYSVSQRTQEIGIRMALGASAQHVSLRVLRQAMALAVAGIVVGAVGAWVTGKLLGSLLYGVSANDPLTFGVMVALLRWWRWRRRIFQREGHRWWTR